MAEATATAQTTSPGGFKNWVRETSVETKNFVVRTGRKVGNWFSRFFNWVGRKTRQAATWISNRAKDTWAWTKRVAKTSWRWGKDKAIRAGRWVNSNAKSIAAWAWAMGKKAFRLGVRGVGYVLRLGSNVVILGMVGLVLIFTAAAWLGDNVAYASQRYEADIHPKFVSMSRGQQDDTVLKYEVPVGKGRPTPTRAESEAARQARVAAEIQADQDYIEAALAEDDNRLQFLESIPAYSEEEKQALLIEANALPETVLAYDDAMWANALKEITDNLFDQLDTGGIEVTKLWSYWRGRAAIIEVFFSPDTYIVIGNTKDWIVGREMAKIHALAAMGIEVFYNPYQQGMEDEIDRLQTKHAVEHKNATEARTKPVKKAAARKATASK